jgi:putative SOS response-associated peptidase YedK
MPVITNKDPERFSFLSWGLVPFWLKDGSELSRIRRRTLNARSETLFDKPSFREPARKRRCLIVVDGYFEWREAAGRTYPYYIHRQDGEAFALAGVWDEWVDPKGKDRLQTFSMLSIAANVLIQKVNNRHQRMPVILPRESEGQWISPGLSQSDIKSMLKTYPDDELEAYPTKRLIGKKGVDSNTPEVLQHCEYQGLSDLS